MNGMLRGLDPDIPSETFDRIAAILKDRSGFCLDGYKDKCVKRRINIRIRVSQADSPEAYCDFLAADPVEQDHLLRVLTIHVSHFYRNRSAFDKLADQILPQLMQARGAAGLHVLSVGCAAGEEPYTVAMIARDRFPEQAAAGLVTIHGTDVDLPTLETARKAVYGVERLAEMTPEETSRWFTQESMRYRLHGEVSSLVRFSQLDLNALEPFEPCDLILCRNVLIYFERTRQEAILNGFADALRPGGMLMLGKSESLFGSARSRFRGVCPVERIYRKAD
jgi:chemotaxis protein methyltransferase CheR